MTDESEDRQRWLAHELHDRLLPWIHGASMQLSNLQVAQQYQLQLETAQHCLKQAAEEGRALLRFLETFQGEESASPSQAIEEFLSIAMPLAAGQSQQIDVPASLNLPDQLPPKVLWSILRIVQQAVMNAIQHAGPCQISVSCKTDFDGSIQIVISDNGCGFTPSGESGKSHFGITSMRQRAESIQASLTIHSKPHEGTLITLKVPRTT